MYEIAAYCISTNVGDSVSRPVGLSRITPGLPGLEVVRLVGFLKHPSYNKVFNLVTAEVTSALSAMSLFKAFSERLARFYGSVSQECIFKSGIFMHFSGSVQEPRSGSQQGTCCQSARKKSPWP